MRAERPRWVPAPYGPATGFLRSQADALLLCDFFETAPLLGTRMYVLAVSEHATRRVRTLGTTAHPTAGCVWVQNPHVLVDLNVLNPHRHTCASLLVDLDVHPRIAMAILRHSDFSITMKVYTQVSSKATRDALKRLGESLGSQPIEKFGAKLDVLAASVEAHGGRAVRRHVQRRGVSHGGAAKMAVPFSRRTLLSPGRAREIAQACRAAEVDVAVFVHPLTDQQRAVLGDMFGCFVISGVDLLTPGR